MATNPSTLPENVGRITPASAAYPYGSAKDDSTGTFGDGTPIKSAVMNDTYGFYQAALSNAGIVPSGNAETATTSQVLQALLGLAGGMSDRSNWPTLANDTGDLEHDVLFGAGKCVARGGKLPIVTSALVKRLDAAWSAGYGGGGLFSGTAAANQTYHCFVIVKADGTADAGFDTDQLAFNIPTGYVGYRRIGSVKTDASANIVRFYQQGDTFWLYDEVLDATVFIGEDGGGTQVDTLTAPEGTNNMQVMLRVRQVSRADSPEGQRCSVQVDSGIAPTLLPYVAGSDFKTAEDVGTSESFFELPLNETAQVTTTQTEDSSPTVSIYTRGWVDDRTE